MKSDTGESTAAIIRRGDDEAWPAVKAALEEGATLIRPARLSRFYPDFGLGPVGVGISATRAKKLEREGVLRYVAPDRYGLVS